MPGLVVLPPQQGGNYRDPRISLEGREKLDLVVLSQSYPIPSAAWGEHIWQYLKTFFFLTLGGEYFWALVGRGQGCIRHPSHTQQRINWPQLAMVVMSRELSPLWSGL